MIDKGKRIAAHVLDVPASAIDFADGLLSARNTNKSISLFEAAEAALKRPTCPTT